MKIIKTNPKNWKVPVKKIEGNDVYLDYADESWYKPSRYIENCVFEATIRPDGYYRGRSAAGFHFVDADDGSKYTMKISKVDELLTRFANGKIKTENGGFKAVFTFSKQGANYSIALYEGEV